MRAHAPLGLFLLTLTACSANVSSPGESDADAVTQTTAVVTFERITTTGAPSTTGTGETRDQVRGAAAARFVQARPTQGQSSVDDRALKLVGAAFEAPPSFGCVALSDELDAAAGRALELADVGSLQVVQTASTSTGQSTGGAGAHAFSLVPRQVPDPVGLVGGVLYYAPSTELSQVVPGARYSVRATGSPGVPSFELSGTSPFEVSDVRIAGQSAGQFPQARAALSAAQSVIDVAWTTPDTARETGDIFFIDIVVHNSNGTLRCAADAFGASIPSPALAAPGQEETNGTISVHRVHREQRARSSAGSQRGPLESSELRFDFSRVVAFTRR